MTRWPLWRLLVWIEAWLLSVAAIHHWRPIHDSFVVPLLIAVIPGIVLVAIRSLAQAATSEATDAQQRASIVELAITAIAIVAAGWWTGRWAVQAHEDLRRIDEALGQSIIIVDISLTGLSVAACFAALTLDWLLATTHEFLRATLAGVRRTHVGVTLLHVGALFGSVWLFTNWPEPAGGSEAASFQRARIALHVYEYAKATIFPVQAFFAALAVCVVTLDSRAES